MFYGSDLRVRSLLPLATNRWWVMDLLVNWKLRNALLPSASCYPVEIQGCSLLWEVLTLAFSYSPSSTRAWWARLQSFEPTWRSRWRNEPSPAPEPENDPVSPLNSRTSWNDSTTATTPRGSSTCSSGKRSWKLEASSVVSVRFITLLIRC